MESLTARLQSLVQACEDPELLQLVLARLAAQSGTRFDTTIVCIRRTILQRLIELDPRISQAVKEQASVLLGLRRVSIAQLRQQRTALDAQVLFDQAEIVQALEKYLQDRPETVRRGLKDESALMRMLAVRVIEQRRLPYQEELLALLEDPEEGVRDAAHAALIHLCRGSDFGPAPGSGKADRARAVERWTQWLAMQREERSGLTICRIRRRGEHTPSPIAVARLDSIATGDEVASSPGQSLSASRTSNDRAVVGSSGEGLFLEFVRAPLEELRKHLAAPDTRVRRAAVHACLLRPEKELSDDLRRLREDSDPGVAEAARDALRRRAAIAP
jgi:HEAT repeat protein